MFRSRKGFTLIKLMIVVAIFGIVVAIAVPNYLAYQKKLKDPTYQSNKVAEEARDKIKVETKYVDAIIEIKNQTYLVICIEGYKFIDSGNSLTQIYETEEKLGDKKIVPMKCEVKG